jgi:hypothetical protein
MPPRVDACLWTAANPDETNRNAEAVGSRRFPDLLVNRRHRFPLGLDSESRHYFLSTPISGAMHAAEYEAYYSLGAAQFERFRADPAG